MFLKIELLAVLQSRLKVNKSSFRNLESCVAKGPGLRDSRCPRGVLLDEAPPVLRFASRKRSHSGRGSTSPRVLKASVLLIRFEQLIYQRGTNVKVFYVHLDFRSLQKCLRGVLQQCKCRNNDYHYYHSIRRLQRQFHGRKRDRLSAIFWSCIELRVRYSAQF